jgi:putative endonuclease
MGVLEKDFRQKCGVWGETLAAQLLEEKGFRVIHRNWRHLHEEIDLIAQDGEVTVFVEVRVRNKKAWVPGFESLTRKKRTVLKRAALAFLEQHSDLKFYRWDVLEYRVMDAHFQQYEVMHYENVAIMGEEFM